jgi:acetyl esterase/lipase
VLSYGCYDLSMTPSVRSLDPEKPLILSYEDASRFIDEYLPGMSMEERRGAQISPLYYNSLAGLCSALFIVGTEDGLTDDTILMSAKWQLAGNEAIVKFVPGAGHGFMTFDGGKVDITRQGWDTMIQYLNYRMPK